MPTLPLDALPDRYAFVDPAGGKKNEAIRSARARSAIVTVATDDCARIFVLDAWAERCATDRLIERIFETQERWHPRTFGIEANAQQGLFADAVALHARWRGRVLPVSAVVQKTTVDKDWRIRTVLQPVIADGRLFVPEGMHELRTELAAFPMGRTKDLVDALASAVALAPNRPMRRERDAEVEALAAFLRASGAPSWYIQQRVQDAVGVAA